MPLTDVYEDDEKFDPIKKIKEYAEEHELQYYPKYSGRGMFGKDCVGFVCSHTEMSDIIAELGIEGAHWDQLGLDMIVYYPELQDKENEDA